MFADVEPYIQVSGLFGNPDEIEKSGLEELSKVDDTYLRDGRKFYQIFRGLFELGTNIFSLSGRVGWQEGYDACQAAAASLKESDEWAITFLRWARWLHIATGRANHNDRYE